MLLMLNRAQQFRTKCPKDKLFRGYIELELQLQEFDRCRKLYVQSKWFYEQLIM